MLSARAGLRTILLPIIRRVRARPVVDLSSACQIAEYGQHGFDTFFGYHDVTPFAPDGRLLLAIRRKAGLGRKAAGTSLDVGFFDLSSREPRFEPFGSTNAWCWQQGCRLQWYAGETSRVLFNVSHQGRHGSRLFDINRREVIRAFDRAIYGVSPNGDSGVSLNFARLQQLRPGYGYDDIADETCNQLAPATDGLWLVDLRTETSRLIVSLADVAAFDPHPSMANAVHYFNHILWSPGSRRFFFIHLWHGRDGKRRGRAFIWDLESSSYWLLGPREHVSHQCWIDDDRLVVFSTEPRSGANYHLYHHRDGCIGVLGQAVLREDGHPSVCAARPGVMVTDTYPNRLGDQSLLVFDMTAAKVETLSRFYSPPRFRGEIRCDLHPRWDLTGRKIAVDSAHTGERRLCVVHLSS